MVCPLTLSLEACGNGIVTCHFFLSALGKILVAVHKILDDNHHLDRELPILFLLLVRLSYKFGVLVKSLGTMLSCPLVCLLIFFLIVDVFFHSAENFNLVNRLNSHAEIFLDEIGINRRSCDTHADRADLEI